MKPFLFLCCLILSSQLFAADKRDVTIADVRKATKEVLTRADITIQKLEAAGIFYSFFHIKDCLRILDGVSLVYENRSDPNCAKGLSGYISYNRRGDYPSIVHLCDNGDKQLPELVQTTIHELVHVNQYMTGGEIQEKSPTKVELSAMIAAGATLPRWNGHDMTFNHSAFAQEQQAIVKEFQGDRLFKISDMSLVKATPRLAALVSNWLKNSSVDRRFKLYSDEMLLQGVLKCSLHKSPDDYWAEDLKKDILSGKIQFNGTLRITGLKEEETVWRRTIQLGIQEPDGDGFEIRCVQANKLKFYSRDIQKSLGPYFSGF
ncbi:MAG: hypothetical protein WCW52_03735 [Elusimicrobiales bacterium]|jgi:hypothetical protein